MTVRLSQTPEARNRAQDSINGNINGNSEDHRTSIPYTVAELVAGYNSVDPITIQPRRFLVVASRAGDHIIVPAALHLSFCFISRYCTLNPDFKTSRGAVA